MLSARGLRGLHGLRGLRGHTIGSDHMPRRLLNAFRAANPKLSFVRNSTKGFKSY